MKKLISVSGSSGHLVVCDGDCQLLAQIRTKKRVQFLTVHRSQAPHRQLVCNNVVRQISLVLSQHSI